MLLTDLIEQLSRPEAFPHPVDTVQVVQTHISVVFLTGDFVYKIKKPVRMDFLDFSTLDKRHHFCQNEVELNRRLASQVYLGVIPITLGPAGPVFGGEGPTMEWAVRMRQLPEGNTLLARLDAGTLMPDQMETLGRRLARFHANARSGADIALHARADVVLRNALENFQQSRAAIGQTVHPEVFHRLESLTRSLGESLRPLLERRVAGGKIRDTHGDLRLDHVYLFPDQPPPDDITIIDCVEFNDAFRYADPVADFAFLVMDLRHHGRPDLADRMVAAYFQEVNDPEGQELLDFYVAYRAAVRAKVDGFQLAEPEISQRHRDRARAKARAHWLFALATLEEPARRPCLVFLGGLPGTGKSVLARGLENTAGFQVIRTDVVRKELAACEPPVPEGLAGMDGGLYRPEFKRQVYAECRRRAEEALFQGGRVLVDGNFPTVEERQAMLQLARTSGVPVCFLQCQVSPEIALERIRQRQGDASDADAAVYHLQAEKWQAADESHLRELLVVDTAPSPEKVLETALLGLRSRGLY